ncbi:matrin-3 isoform X1 [Coregonus clupeaformis]|uniref:matrin-3 isoform X1 n=1 Tax=Coregonus clupeaformis TaxID=59861 RepID=UPI001BE08D9E|nr:matrin-3 isoform X1 [Coregonus clupeaformis]XP_041750228.1 matrin-3 isoform X1 [Coregonus clupeaformis]
MEDSEGHSSAHQGSGDGVMSTMNLYATLGLSPEDVDALAQIPENEISVETLPYLIMQLKAKRAKQEGQGEASPKRDSQQEDTDDGDRSKQDSPPAVPPQSNSHCDTDYRRVEIHSRPERTEARRNSRHTRSSRGKISDSQQKFPFSYQVDDFHGVVPKIYPHTCSLCFCMLNSSKTWKDHLNGLRHVEGCRELLRLYPDWKIRDTGREMSNSIPSRDAISPPRKMPRPAMPYKRQHGSDRVRGEVWSAPERHHLKPKAGTKVVVTKFPLGSVGVEDLMTLAKPFGTVVKHLVFPCKGFLEFGSHKEAVNMVNHFSEKQAFVKGNKLILYLSPMVCSIHPPRLDEPPEKRQTKQVTNTVVCFSRLPPGKEREPEILDLAKMFGDVRHSTFSGDQALIEMVDWKDADIMVKYYHSNPLKINGKSVKVFLSLKRLRESPDSTTSRRADSSKGRSSRHKSEETSKTSNSTNKEKPSTGKQPTEKVLEQGEDQQITSEEVKEVIKQDIKEEDIDLENKDLDEEGVQVKAEQSLLDDEVGSGVDTKNPAPSKSASLVADSKDKGEPEISELLADNTLEASDIKAADDPALCDADVSMENMMEKESFHEDDNMDDMDFPENMDDFVTLDELDNNTGGDTLLESKDASWDGKVVQISPIRKGYGSVEVALLKLAERANVKVVNHYISFVRQEAWLELETTEEVREMVKFYKGKGQLLRKRVDVSMCFSLKKLESPSGRSIYICMLPLQKYSDVSLLRLAQPFGKITGYNLNWRHGKCYIQLESVEAAQKMVKYFERPHKFYGTLLRVSLCKKGDSLIYWKPPVKYELWLAGQKNRRSRDHHGDEKTNGQSAKSPSPEVKEMDVQSPVSDSEGVCGDPEGEEASGVEAIPEGEEEEEEKQEEPLGPYQPDNPVGLDYLVPRTGLFCKLCNIFYTNEKTAKSVHCSSEEHYMNLKGKMDKDKQTPAD